MAKGEDYQIFTYVVEFLFSKKRTRRYVPFIRDVLQQVGIHEQSADLRILHCHRFDGSSLRICTAEHFTLILVHIAEEN